MTLDQAAPRMGVLTEPPPAVDQTWAGQVLAEAYALSATLSPLRSERDRNYLAAIADGDRVVVKVSNSAEDPDVVAMENAAMEHVRRVDPRAPIPRLLPSTEGSLCVSATAPDGRTHLVRVVTALEGEAADTHPLPAGFAAEHGRHSARMALALQGFFHPAGGRHIDWDPRRVDGLRQHLDQLAASERALVAEALDRVSDLPARTDPLPASVLHADVTMSNVLVDATSITGVVDFGDMHHTARVADAAISLASLLRVVAQSGEDPWLASAQFLAGYQRVCPLLPEEIDVLGDLILARLSATLLISAWRAPQHPDNVAYLTGLDRGSRLMLEALLAYSDEVLTQRFARLCGTGRVRPGKAADPTLLARRQQSMGGDVAPLFYREPLHIVSGDGAWLLAADGRRLLDAYNNVAVVGHEHPTVVQAITQQVRALNTNSRYLHHNVVELAERILASMPAELDTCIFVNSGSEATDLAWRLATTWTGGTGGIVTDCSYHGVSAATSALSSNTWPAGFQPEHVAVFQPPSALPDGTSPGPTSAAGRVAAATADLADRGHRPALLAVDPMFTSAGVLEPTPGFMSGLVDAAHEVGSLFLADEVQAGFGRGGRHLWRFADFGVVPDLVALGKPMGNGHPVAALVTRREIADRLASVDEFFSTFAGNPVSCAASLAVLDVIEQEGLLVRAATVGEHLRARVRDLASDRSAVGAVRGAGLIAGIDLVGPEGPSADFTVETVNQLRARAVLVGNTGRDRTVLKVRPPLVWTDIHVGVFIDALADVLDP